jgi:hypothetical protein
MSESDVYAPIHRKQVTPSEPETKASRPSNSRDVSDQVKVKTFLEIWAEEVKKAERKEQAVDTQTNETWSTRTSRKLYGKH